MCAKMQNKIKNCFKFDKLLKWQEWPKMAKTRTNCQNEQRCLKMVKVDTKWQKLQKNAGGVRA